MFIMIDKVRGKENTYKLISLLKSFLFIITDKTRVTGGGKEKVSVLRKTKEVKFEEIKVSLTLGGTGEGGVQGKGK